MIENRKAYRFPFRTKVILADQKRVSTTTSVNLSMGGLYATSLEPYPRNTRVRCVFCLDEDENPVSVWATVQRVVVPTVNVEILPGLALSFDEGQKESIERVRMRLVGMQRDLEMAAAILLSGEPDFSSMKPLLKSLHLSDHSDLGSLRYTIERILRSIELIQKPA